MAGRKLLLRARAFFSEDRVALRDTFVALLLVVLAGLGAGATLAAVSGTLQELPGLLLLVPAAIAVKGNVFGAVGSRLGTAIHTGTFRAGTLRATVRLDSVVGQNTVAAMVLSLFTGVALAVLVKGFALAFDISPTMTLSDFIVISTVGGLLAAVVILLITLALTTGAVRFGWDLDNVVAPVVTATADVITIPALVVAAELAGVASLTPVMAWLLAVLAVVVGIWSVRTKLVDQRRIIRESIPILLLAGILDLLAGITVENRLDDFLTFPVLLVLLPGYLGVAGALGGVLSSRLATKLHLGLVRPAPFPQPRARGDIVTTFLLALPVFALLGMMAALGGDVTGTAGPGFGQLMAVVLLGGLLATVFVVAVAYYTTIAAVRFGLDPDSYGIPMVTSSLDFAGAGTFILALTAVGVT